MKKAMVMLVAALMLLGLVGQAQAGYTIPRTAAQVTGTGQAVGKAGNKVYSITLFSATAGDYIGVYNANLAPGTPGYTSVTTPEELEFDIGISANSSSTTLYLGENGQDFSQGVYVKSSSATAVTSVQYDY